MAWSPTLILTSDELDAKAENYPLIIMTNILNRNLVEPEWRESGRFGAGSDQTLAGASGYFAADHVGHRATKANASGVSEFSLIFTLDPSTADEGQIDSIVVLNHNFAALGPNLEVSVEISSDDFQASVDRIAQWSTAGGDFVDDRRLVELDISSGLLTGGTAPLKVAGIDYLRLKIEKTSGTLPVAPEIGELICGRRVQLTGKADRPFPVYHRGSTTKQIKSDNGKVTSIELDYGKAELPFDFNLGQHFATLDPFVEIKKMAKQTRAGSRPFVYVEDPATDPDSARFMRIDQTESAFHVTQPSNGPFEAMWSPTFMELHPYLLPEVE